MTITGSILIGQDALVRQGEHTAIDAATGSPMEPAYGYANLSDLDRACGLADDAATPFAATSPEFRAVFLETICQEIADIGELLVERAMAESGLPRAAIEGERTRTINQLRLFAGVLREGSWAKITIDDAMPDRLPFPRPELRLQQLALGPVAVFGASNYPLAFSVAGGDTASAFAAGCPVVVKGHPAHPGTGELVARAIQRAVGICGLPDGTFSFLPGGDELGAALVADSRIKAVGFTGSRNGGVALMRIAAERKEPIPVYAEMSAINPVILFPGALSKDAAGLGKAFVNSLTLRAGQMCTNPGLAIAVESPELDTFLDAAGAALEECPAQNMLTPNIHAAFSKGVAKLYEHPAITPVGKGRVPDGPQQGQAALFKTSASAFAEDTTLANEVFGSSSIVVTVADMREAARTISLLDGQLAIALFIEPEDEEQAAKLMPLVERKAGRVIANGWPTNVEVCHAIVHGGPYPATSDGRTTAVGALAIERFLRPVCYQNMPASLLPEGLGDENPWNAPRRINGAMRTS